MFKKISAAAVIITAALSAPGMAECAETVLTVTGAEGVKSYTLADLEALPQVRFTTSTIWTAEAAVFEGVPLRALLDETGIDEGAVLATAINDYSIEIPVSEVTDSYPIVAYRMDGKEMSRAGQGAAVGHLSVRHRTGPEHRGELLAQHLAARQAQRDAMTILGRGRRLIAKLLPALFALAVAVLFVVAWNHHRDIRTQIDRLAIANSDSTQWFLAQLEVEAMAAERAILTLRDNGNLDAQLADIRKRFDIFYSRAQTLRNGRTFTALRQQPEVMGALERLQVRLDEAVPLIDGSPAQLLASQEDLSRQMEAAMPLVRQISLAGVRQFARQSDEQRQAVVRTLFQLSLLLVPLILVLVATTVVLFVMFRAAGVQTARIAAAGERMRSLFDASTDAILFARPDGRVRGYNKAAERIFGYEPEEVINADLVELLTPLAQRDSVRALLAEVQAGRPRGDASEPAVVMTTAKHKSGRIVPVEMSWSIASDSQGRLLVAYVRDVSQRAQEEAELIEARDRAVAGENAKARLIAVMSHEMRNAPERLAGHA